MPKWETVWLCSFFALLVQKYKNCLLALLVQRSNTETVCLHIEVLVCVCVCMCVVGMFGRSVGLRHVY